MINLCVLKLLLPSFSNNLRSLFNVSIDSFAYLISLEIENMLILSFVAEKRHLKL